jgi:hypothetical protein
VTDESTRSSFSISTRISVDVHGVDAGWTSNWQVGVNVDNGNLL